VEESRLKFIDFGDRGKSNGRSRVGFDLSNVLVDSMVCRSEWLREKERKERLFDSFISFC